jgi:hypothetical protein
MNGGLRSEQEWLASPVLSGRRGGDGAGKHEDKRRKKASS